MKLNRYSKIIREYEKFNSCFYVKLMIAQNYFEQWHTIKASKVASASLNSIRIGDLTFKFIYHAYLWNKYKILFQLYNLKQVNLLYILKLFDCKQYRNCYFFKIHFSFPWLNVYNIIALRKWVPHFDFISMFYEMLVLETFSLSIYFMNK